MNVRIVVADERQASFFDITRPSGPLASAGAIQNPVEGKRDTELETDRAGRRFGGTAGHHHGVNGERSTVQHELTQFARVVAQRIDHDRTQRAFDKLVIVAPPKMLGVLRQALPETCKGVIAGEISKDLLHRGSEAILEAVPRDVFFQ